MWLTTDQVKTANNFLGYQQYRGYGCYRNPCNQPGAGKLSQSTCGYQVFSFVSCNACLTLELQHGGTCLAGGCGCCKCIVPGSPSSASGSTRRNNGALVRADATWPLGGS
jgi:hypothetical protein